MALSVVKALAVVALTCVVGCGVGFGTTTSSVSDGPAVTTAACAGDSSGVTVYYDNPPVADESWWYVGQEPADVVAGEADLSGSASGDIDDDAPADQGTPPPPPDASDLGGGTWDSGSDSGDVATQDPGADDSGDPGADDGGDWDDTETETRPALAGACFTCELTCTTLSPDPTQPLALATASGASTRSEGAACARAEHELREYAAHSYGLELSECSSSESATRAPVRGQG